ncbi:hypothetical protein Thu_247 [Bacillus phage Thurquoise]|nr:hypothetical protein Thu_3 [Bacillus phage Thurquoise]UXQ89090.1 hypothetical protein Thu_247 [Bacillus phage Thurquoise]
MFSFRIRAEAHFIFVEQLSGQYLVEKDSMDLFVPNKVDRTEVENLLRISGHRIVVFDTDGNVKAKNYL